MKNKLCGNSEWIYKTSTIPKGYFGTKLDWDIGLFYKISFGYANIIMNLIKDQNLKLSQLDGEFLRYDRIIKCSSRLHKRMVNIAEHIKDINILPIDTKIDISNDYKDKIILKEGDYSYEIRIVYE